jgi:hypothetical protein
MAALKRGTLAYTTISKLVQRGSDGKVIFEARW